MEMEGEGAQEEVMVGGIDLTLAGLLTFFLFYLLHELFLFYSSAILLGAGLFLLGFASFSRTRRRGMAQPRQPVQK